MSPSICLNLRNSHLLGFFVLTVVMGALAWPSKAQELDVPYVPTPKSVVEKMLDMAQVEAGDYVIDLGSGDGRIVIAAAKRGANGHGVDLDPERIREARNNANQQNVQSQVMFLNQDLFDTDISHASVITMYLLPSVNIKLRPAILKQLRPGTRVVSHRFDMDAWQADKAFDVESSSGVSHEVYLWIVPADAAGMWTWEIDGRTNSLEVNQQFQEIDLNLTVEGNGLETSDEILRGRRISFRATDGPRNYLYSGRVDGNTISGTVQIRNANNQDTQRIENWKATKN